MFYWFIYSPLSPLQPVSNKNCKNRVLDVKIVISPRRLSERKPPDDSLELKFRRVKHLRDMGLETHAESYYWFDICEPARDCLGPVVVNDNYSQLKLHNA